MNLLEKIQKAVLNDKQKLLLEKSEILNEIQDFVKDTYNDQDYNTLIEVRQFITNRQSYFARTYSYTLPNLLVDNQNILLLSPEHLKEAYENAIQINQELNNESEAIYESLLPKNEST
ncbi:hypothetical protein [uncultured Chryseobacterium sp.]|uniref:hypothetical protein n=1 Tax=uncultured Chryseobacterium sp. TaxID=259322 RepID=UPI0025D30FBB|nr:hypothetical protein [uncultured Chryseobacterium sp.]